VPFKSKAQQGYLFSQKPDVAQRFAAETPKDAYKNLPPHVKKKKRKHVQMLANALKKK
jgi:hypothetical protein